ncbi:MAG: antibiotic biosynthesis monooxygenase family protein [Candidatus Acidiferrales bacterium]
MTIAQENQFAGDVPLFVAGIQDFSKMNARTVEFIAKAGKEDELRKRFTGGVLELLKRKEGFAGLFVLSSHKEPRRHLVLTFWKTAHDAGQNQWEESAAVRRQVSSLIDVCAKVQTYEAICAGLADPDAMALRETC